MKPITYQERIQLLREKKIQHTLEKTKKEGYMDGDDYGTVPLPDDYHFNPPYAPGRDYLLGAMDNARAFAAFLKNHPLYVDPLEILAGRWADMLPHYRRADRAYRANFPYEELKDGQEFYNINSGIGADAHCACDYHIGLQLGFGGMLEKIRKYREEHGPEKREFYDAEEMVVLAIQDFIKRHIDLAETLFQKEEDPELRRTLSLMIQTNRRILSHKPETFLEACQWIAWFNTCSRMYDRDGAGCCLDDILYPYYQADLDAGRITKEDALFILANLLLNDTHYYQLSGADENDNDLTNPLSYLILDAAHALNVSANLTVRVHDHIDPAFMKKAVWCLFHDRNGWPRFSGDRGLMNYMKNEGVSKADARSRIAVGCNWMAVPGLEYPLNDCIKINVARVFEAAMQEMEQEGDCSVNRLFSLFESHLDRAIDITARGVQHHLNHQHEVMPELVMNLMMQNTLERGEDISVCAKYLTMGVDGVGLGTVADSFAALEQRVETDKILGWNEMFDALRSDYAGAAGERIRLMLKSSPRYCQGNSRGDFWAQKISALFAKKVHEYPMPGRSQLVPGWFSWSSTIAFGKAVGATPDGRHAHTPVTHGANPNPGFRKDGAATAMATGIAKIQTAYGNTCPLQLEMDPKISADDGGLENVERLLRTHIEMGGTLININILDRDKLMAAHKDPMLYPDLVVRVTGFTAYFATLSPEFRQLVVDRFVDGF